MFKKLKNFVANRIFTFLILFITIAIIILMIFLNDIIYYIRLYELSVFLRILNRTESNIDYIGMITKYKLHREWYKNKITSTDFEKKELRTSFLTMNLEKNISESQYKKYSQIIPYVIEIINVIRTLLNKNSIHLNFDDKITRYLSSAYYYERNKNYFKALNIYNESLKTKDLPNQYIPVIKLHQGYCYSIIGDFENAHIKYMNIINEYDKEKIAGIAALLLEYMREFQSEIAKIKASDEKSIEKSEKLIKLIAYSDAFAELDKIKEIDEDEKEKIVFYKARCLEETGEKTESAKLYQDLIEENPESNIARQSNRRLLLMSASDQETKSIKKLAEKNNEIIADSEFDSLLKDIQNIEEMEKKEDIALAEKKIAEINKNNQENKQIKTENNELEDFITNSIKKINETIDQKNKQKKQTKTVTKIRSKRKPIIRKPFKKEFKNKNGQLYKLEHYDKNGKLESFYLYDYDEKGMMKKLSIYDNSKNLLKYYEYEYSEDGKESYLKLFDANGNLIEE